MQREGALVESLGDCGIELTGSSQFAIEEFKSSNRLKIYGTFPKQNILFVMQSTF